MSLKVPIFQFGTKKLDESVILVRIRENFESLYMDLKNLLP